MSHTELVFCVLGVTVAQQPPNLLGVGSSPTGRVPVNNRGYMTSEEIKEMADENAIVWDGFDDAIVGVDNTGRLVYDIDAMVRGLTERDDMSEEDALDYLGYNVFGTYVGELTPIHVYLHT